MRHVVAVIAAAGSSSRLGQPKQLLMVDGEPLLQRAIRFAHEAGASPVFVVLGAHREMIESRVDLAAAKIVANEVWKEGIASSIRAGIEAVQAEAPDASGVLLMICDQPGVTSEHLRRMLNVFWQSPETAVASVYAGGRGTPAIFPGAAFADLNALGGDKGARSLLTKAPWPVTGILLEGGEIDIDQPEDLAQLGR
ncbi:MAG TPA: nucleotidyltransferase family protein [Terracidiphilus sp.]|jgi:molybdenum cofactor cytidylyltransferase